MRFALSTFASLIVALVLHAQDVYTVTQLDLRPAADDFAPVLVDSGLVITSLRERDQVIDYSEATTGKPLADLYSVRIRNGKPGRPQLMDGSVCTNMHDGPATFDPTSTTLCLTRNIQTGRAARSGKGADQLGLFFAQRDGKAWTPTVPFALNSNEYSVMDASFSADGKQLFFASDMPGGQGGADLYVCDRTADGWGPARNLGPGVNSPANELFPSASLKGQLFFSSDRAGGLGKMDIYKCALENDQWNAPVALPAPLNSVGNEIGYAAYPDGLSGFISSDRESGDRIYKFNRSAELFRNCVAQQKNNYCYTFEDQGSFNTDTLPLSYQWDLGDGTFVAGLTAPHCFSKPGHYTVKLNIVDTLTKSVFFNEASYDLDVDDVEQAYINVLDSGATAEAMVFNTDHTSLPGFTADEYHWDLGDGAQTQAMELTHAYSQAGTYKVRLDLLARPDANGNFVNHCVERTLHVIDGFVASTTPSIVVDRSTASNTTAGFEYRELPHDEMKLTVMEGEDVLYTVQIASSATRVSIDDPRFLPIRRYYPVIERFDPVNNTYTYSVGAAKSLNEIYSVYSKTRQLHYLDGEVAALHQDKLLDMAQLSGLPLEALNNSVLRVNTVLFRSGQRTFDATFRATLDKVLNIVSQHPQVDLVIEAHTDDVGTEESNIALSQERAQSIREYFLAHGVDGSRLVPIGFGENNPLESNATPDGRTKNRRVEFRLTVRDNGETAHP